MAADKQLKFISTKDLIRDPDVLALAVEHIIACKGFSSPIVLGSLYVAFRSALLLQLGAVEAVTPELFETQKASAISLCKSLCKSLQTYVETLTVEEVKETCNGLGFSFSAKPAPIIMAPLIKE